MKFKEELLRIIMNGCLLLTAAGVSILYRSARLHPLVSATWAFSSAILLLIVARIIAKGIDNSYKK